MLPMKKRKKRKKRSIIGIIIGATVFLVLVYGLITYLQYRELKVILGDDEKRSTEITEELQKIIDGDCSNIEYVIEIFEDARKTLKRACINPILKKFLNKERGEIKGVCEMMDQPDNIVDLYIEQTREYCPSS